MRKLFSSTSLLAACAALLFGLASCDATFHDSLDACRNTLLVSLKNGECDAVTGATPHTGANAKPANGEKPAQKHEYLAPAGKTLLLAFDSNNLLAADTLLNLDKASAVKQVPLSVVGGNHTLVVWSGINDAQWQMAKLERGKTRISDALLTQRSAVDTHLATGSNTAFVTLPNPTKAGSHTQEVTVPLHRTNFNITADVEVGAETFDALDDLTADSFDIQVKLDFESLTVDGRTQKAEKSFLVPVTKEAIDVKKNEDGKVVKTVLRTHFVVPALNVKDAHVTLSLINNGGEGSRIIEKGTFDLLSLLHLQNGENGAVNNGAGVSHFDPQCDRSAMLRFRLSDRCLSCGAYACYQVWAGDIPLVRFTDAEVQ